MKGWWTRASFSAPENNTPFIADEDVSWGGGTRGKFQLEDDIDNPETHRLVVDQRYGGPDPTIGTVITGNESGAARKITAWSGNSIGVSIHPNSARLPFAPNFDGLVELEWKIDVAVLHSAVTQHAIDVGGGWGVHFRFLLSYLSMFAWGGGAGVFFSLKNVIHNTTNEAQSGNDQRRGLDWNNQDTPKGGLLVTTPAAFPRWQLQHGDPDGIGGNNVWISFHTHDEYPVPTTIHNRAKMVGLVTDPPGTQLAQMPVGTWIPLIGTFAMWDFYTKIGSGPEVYIGRSYGPVNSHKSLSPQEVISHFQEFFSQYPDLSWTRLSDDPVDVRYYDHFVFDGNLWHSLNDWRIHKSHPFPEPDCGWSAQIPGKLTMSAGISAYALENDLYADGRSNRHVLCGMTYETADAQPLSFVGIVTSNGYNGPAWNRPGGYPYFQQDADHGFYILHPSDTVAASNVFTATYAGIYSFVGNFARAATGVGLGNGVDVSIRKGATTLWGPFHVEQNHSVDPADPFAPGGSDLPFTVSNVSLEDGEKVYFTVSPTGGWAGYAQTAFRMRYSFEKTAPVTMPFSPTVTPEVANEPRWVTQILGGGYERVIGRVADYRRSYSLEFTKRTKAQALEIEQYLRGRGEGSFIIRDPDSDEAVTVRVQGEPKRTRDGRLRTIALSVLEVYE